MAIEKLLQYVKDNFVFLKVPYSICLKACYVPNYRSMRKKPHYHLNVSLSSVLLTEE